MKKTIRLDENGKPDDIVIKCDEVHIERLSDGCWWIGASKGKERVAISLIIEYSPPERRAWISATVIE